VSTSAMRRLSFAKTPSGEQAVDLSALIRRQSPSYDQHPAPPDLGIDGRAAH
jgi:hypothetical protein